MHDNQPTLITDSDSLWTTVEARFESIAALVLREEPSTSSAVSTWGDTRRLLVSAVGAYESLANRRLEELAPAISVVRAAEVDSSHILARVGSWSTRTRNVLAREGLHLWGDVTRQSYRQLARLRGAGTTVLNELVSKILDLAFLLEEDSKLGGSEEQATEDVGSIASGTGVDQAFEMVTDWARLETDARTVGAVLQALDAGPIPPDVAEAWAEIQAQSIGNGQRPRGEPAQAVEDWIEQQDERREAILRQRLFSHGSKARLEEIAVQFDLSRERVRQIETTVKSSFEGFVASAPGRQVRWRAIRIREIVGIWAPLNASILSLLGGDASMGLDRAGSQALLRLAGPYEIADGNLILVGSNLPVLSEFMSETGRVDVSALEEAIGAIGVKSEWLQPAVSECLRECVYLNGAWYLWRRSAGDRAVVLLASHGKSATVEEIHSMAPEAGWSIGTLRNALGADPRVMRTGKKGWALREWGLEEYSGIAEELRERLELIGGGPLPLEDLASELAGLFGVAPGSVRIYADAPAFVLERGLLRMRTPNEPYPVRTDLLASKGLYREGADLIVHLNVDATVLRNGSTIVDRAVAGVLGVVPGAACLYTSDNGDVLQCNWPDTVPFGPLFTKLRSVLQRHGVREGDLVRLRFHGSRFSASVVPPAIPEEAAVSTLRRLTGLALNSEDIVGQVAASVGIGRQHLREVLTRRGDRDVVAALPFASNSSDTNDEALAAALSEIDSILS